MISVTGYNRFKNEKGRSTKHYEDSTTNSIFSTQRRKTYTKNWRKWKKMSIELPALLTSVDGLKEGASVHEALIMELRKEHLAMDDRINVLVLSNNRKRETIAELLDQNVWQTKFNLELAATIKELNGTASKACKDLTFRVFALEEKVGTDD